MIRNLLYLDTDKLRSFSSQIFEGITERIVNTELNKTENKEEQKGPVTSGLTLANILASGKSSSESKFLEDYAYTLFENKLRELNILKKSQDLADDNIVTNSFIEVSGILNLNDLKSTSVVLKEFNDIGKALWRVQNEQMNTPLNRTVSDQEAKKKALESGLQLNEKVTAAAATLINFGFGELLEAIIVDEGRRFTSPLKRFCLREGEDMVLYKYSRTTQMPFTLVGLVTRKFFTENAADSPPDVKDSNSIRDAMRIMALHVNIMENFFSAPSKNEIVVDPIAIYSMI